ncbi:TonB-dependent receptor [Rheinheimera gaetbuli]
MGEMVKQTKSILFSALAFYCQPAFTLALADSTQQHNTDNSQVERLTIQGQRNMPQTEVDEDTQKLLNVAAVMGDPIQAIYTLPGVVYDTTESAPAVRGSSPFDNHFMLDGQRSGPLLNNLYGSAINPELLAQFDLYPAAFAAPFGHATGAVFDLRLRDPKAQPLGAVVDLNILRTSILAEGALTENQAFYAAYRLSTLQHFVAKDDELEDGITVTKPPQLSDYQLRYQWRPGQQHKVTLTTLGVAEKAGINLSAASDAGRIDPENVGDAAFNTNWHSQQVRYQFFGNNGQQLSLAALNLQQSEKASFGDAQFYRLEQDYRELQISWQQRLNSLLSVHAGAETGALDVTYEYDLIPYYCTDHQQDCQANRGEREQDNDGLTQRYHSAFIDSIWQLSADIRWQLGIRYDKERYTNADMLAPRTQLSWQLTDKLQWFASAGRHQQTPELEQILPKVGNRQLNSPKADHFATGGSYQFSGWQLKLELYYKKLWHLARALAPQLDVTGQHYASDVTGTARGIELMLEKQLTNNWSGWVSLSYSQSDRKDPLTAVTTEYRLDTPLVVNAVLNYKLNQDWTMGAVFTGRSGNRYSPIIGARPNPYHPDYLLPVYGDLNSERLPFYHRLDVEFKRNSQVFGRPAEYTFAVRNLYNRENISGYYLLNTPDTQSYRIDKEEDLGIFPYAGVKVWF